MHLSQLDKDLINDTYRTRRILGWSQQRLANHFKIDRTVVTKVENIRRAPSNDVRYKMALFLYENKAYSPLIYATDV